MSIYSRLNANTIRHKQTHPVRAYLPSCAFVALPTVGRL